MKKKLVICIALLFAAIIASSHAYSLNQSKESYQILKESIQALDITKKKSQKNLLNLDQFQNKSLYNEYSVFIEYLSFRINKYCSQIYELYGESLLNGLPCYFNKSQSQKLDENKYITAEEQLQLLDDELMSTLGDFDEMLLEEDDMIAQTSRKTTSNKQYSAAEQDGSNKQDSHHSNKKKKDPNQKTDKSSVNNNKQANKVEGKRTKDKEYKRNKLDKIGDDIVARQLKEAAENESDAELKEKIWDEYYKYKQNKIK